MGMDFVVVLGHAIRLGACDRREAGREVERLGKQSRFPRYIGRAIIREMLDSMRGSGCAEPLHSLPAAGLRERVHK